MREEITMNRCAWLIIFVLTLAAWPAFGRTWTFTPRQSTTSQTVEGEFLNYVRGQAVISSSGQVIRLPFGFLAPADQEFVRQWMDKQGRGNELPPRRIAQPAGSQANSTDRSKPVEPKLAAGANASPADERTWTDIHGAKTLARFAGMDNGQVALQSKAGSKNFPYDGFSVEDKEYLRKLMISRGEGDKLPAGSPSASAQAAPSQVALSQNVSSNPPAKPQTQSSNRSGPPRPSMGRSWPPGSPPPWWNRGKPGTPNPKPPQELASAASSPQNPKQSASNPSVSYQSPSNQSANNQSASNQSLSNQSANLGAAPVPSATPPKPSAVVGNSMAANSVQASAATANTIPPVQKRICSNCKKELPDTCKPGDYCPSCGAYLDYEDSADQVRVSGPFRFSKVGIPAGIACLLYAAVVGIVRLQWKPEKKR